MNFQYITFIRVQFSRYNSASPTNYRPYPKGEDMLLKSRPHNHIHIMLLLATLCATVVSAGSPPSRLDLFDASDNHLMYILFTKYNGGFNIEREVFMSDGTFMRRVVINYNSADQRVSEVSFNFNDDTSYVMKYQPENAVKNFSLFDQFKVDQVGGPVNYAPGADPLKFDLTYQKSGAVASQVSYEKDAEGNLTKVLVSDQNGQLSYYGSFTTDGAGVKQSKASLKGGPQASVRTRGTSIIEVSFNLRMAGEVRCDLITLSGRHAATLLRDNMKQGSQKKQFRLDGQTLRGMAGGVYIFAVSVNGVTVSRSRYLHQNVGGVR